MFFFIDYTFGLVISADVCYSSFEFSGSTEISITDLGFILGFFLFFTNFAGFPVTSLWTEVSGMDYTIGLD